MGHRYAAVSEWLQSIGADLEGFVASSDWAQYLPESDTVPGHQTILIFGAGGPDFIRRYQAYAQVHGCSEHWLADYAQHMFEDWAGGPSDYYLNPYRSGFRFPFQRAAEAAGLGVMGLNHVILNPTWGPWFSLLGAILLADEIAPTGTAAFNPCVGCDAPCLRACPSGAVSATGYDGVRCIETKLTHRPCLHACPARHACVLRPDLRPEMLKLEASRPRDDGQTREMLSHFLLSR